MTTKKPQLVVTVELARGDVRVISGRVARMIAWLCDHRDSIESINRGRVDVTLSGEFQEWHVTETRAGY